MRWIAWISQVGFRALEGRREATRGAFRPSRLALRPGLKWFSFLRGFPLRGLFLYKGISISARGQDPEMRELAEKVKQAKAEMGDDPGRPRRGQGRSLQLVRFNEEFPSKRKSSDAAS